MATPDTDFDAPAGENIGFGDLARKQHRIVQRQGMAKGAEAEIARALGELGIERQGRAIDGEFFEERMLQRVENAEAALVGMLGAADHIVDQFGMIAPWRALKFDISSQTQFCHC